jgi:hypothetical protein
MLDEMRLLIDEVKKLNDDQQGPFVTWLIVVMIRDVAYYAITGIVAWALGRRLIQGIFTAIREAGRERA